MTSELIWQHLDSAGFEHVRIMDDHPGWTVFDSILVREDDGQVLRGGYTLVLDKQWRTLELRLMVETSPGSMEGIHLLTEGDGRWTDADEHHIPELDGCIDVDIQWSPLSNTLPINRLSMVEGTTHPIDVVYVSLPELTMHKMRQHYTRLDDSQIRLTVDGVKGEFLMTVDQDGFVTQYQDLFTRAWPR